MKLFIFLSLMALIYSVRVSIASYVGEGAIWSLYFNILPWFLGHFTDLTLDNIPLLYFEGSYLNFKSFHDFAFDFSSKLLILTTSIMYSIRLISLIIWQISCVDRLMLINLLSIKWLKLKLSDTFFLSKTFYEGKRVGIKYSWNRVDLVERKIRAKKWGNELMTQKHGYLVLISVFMSFLFP